MDTVRGLFGFPAKKLDAISSFARQLLTRAQRNRRLVRADSLESFIGKAQCVRVAVPDTALHLRALYNCVPARTTASMPLTFSWETMPGFHSYCAFIPSGFESSGILEGFSQPATSPAYWPEASKPTVAIHTDASMTAYGATMLLENRRLEPRAFTNAGDIGRART
jgi:hypothetical protein